MKKLVLGLVGAAFLSLLASLAGAQNFQGGGGPGGMGLRLNVNGAMQLDAISKAVTLTDDQQTKLKAIADKVDADLQENQKPYMNTFKAIQPGNDPAAIQELNRKRQEASQQMQAKRQALLAQSITDMEALLTPDQTETWQGYKLQQTVLQRLRTAGGLTEEQQTALEKLTKAAAKDLAALKTPADEAASNAIQGKLWKQVVALLTDDQITRITGGSGAASSSGMGGVFMNGGGGANINVMPVMPPAPLVAPKAGANGGAGGGAGGNGIIIIHEGGDAPQPNAR